MAIDAHRKLCTCQACGDSFEGYVHGSEPKWCSVCGPRQKDHRKRVNRYGLTRSEYDELQASPVCAACGEPARGRMSVDHCHETGRVRGLVHQPCNVGMGQAGDDPEVLFRWAVHLADLDLVGML